MPGYLVLNATGPRKYRGVPNSHFNPWSALFGAKDRIDIIWSDIGFFAALTGTTQAYTERGQGRGGGSPGLWTLGGCVVNVSDAFLWSCCMARQP